MRTLPIALDALHPKVKHDVDASPVRDRCIEIYGRPRFHFQAQAPGQRTVEAERCPRRLFGEDLHADVSWPREQPRPVNAIERVLDAPMQNEGLMLGLDTRRRESGNEAQRRPEPISKVDGLLCGDVADPDLRLLVLQHCRCPFYCKESGLRRPLGRGDRGRGKHCASRRLSSSRGIPPRLSLLFQELQMMELAGRWLDGRTVYPGHEAHDSIELT